MGEISQESIEPGKFRQFVAAVVANLSALSYGTLVGWQSPVQWQLQGPDSPVGEPMTDEEASWLTAAMCLGGAATTLAIGAATERLGRKATGCLIAVPYLLCWLLTIFAGARAHLYAARFLAGVGGAGTIFLVPLYVSEIACDGVRGMLGSLLVLALNLGILVAYVLGALLSFRWFAVAAITLPVAYVAAFAFLPETPVYLVRRKRPHEAARSLMWFRAGHKPTVERELLRLQAQAKEIATSAKSVGLADLVKDKATAKGLIITLGLFGGQQLCGIFAVISYTETIFRVSGSSMSPNASAILVGAIQLFGSYLSTSLMERTGRRPLLLISCAGMCACHLVLGAFCYLRELRHDVSELGWVPVVALCAFMIAYCLGMGPGPYVMMSEVFSREASGLASTCGLLFVWSMAFVVVKFFASLVALLGMHGCFFLLAAFCACSLAFVFVLVPETKGKSRELIVDELAGATYAFDEEQLAAKRSRVMGLAPVQRA